MKKFFTYILIFVTILQLVVPPSSVEAQSLGLGVCKIYNSATENYAKGDITFVACKTLAAEARFDSFRATLSATWQDGPGGEIFPAVALASGGGGGNTTVLPSATTGCYNSQGQPGPQTDPATCVSQGHIWHIKNGSSISSANPSGCYNAQGQSGPQETREACLRTAGNFWYEKPGSTTTPPGGSGTLGDTGSAVAPGDAPKDPNADIFGSCQGMDLLIRWNVNGCIVRAFHLVFMVLPSMVLYLTAYIFNAMLALTLGTVLYKNSFLPEAWRIVRDFSNIFFILVLLYISIKMILGLGGAEVKKMIAQVIVAALLINFSMFMTQVIIDASNMLALIFYNKIQVTSQTYTPFISTKNGVQDKDIAGAIASGFNPAKFINPADVSAINNAAVSSGGLFNDLKNIGKDPSTTINPLRPLDNTTTNLKIGWALAKSALTSGGDEKTFPPSIALAIIFTACAVYLFASYAFFIAGLAFIGRLIELWMLIIFSPFAFMSLSVPKLKGIDYLGWDAWLKRLLSVAFMAPVFMFFLLLISKLVQINIFKGMENVPGDTLITIPHVLVMLIIPAIIYISLLWKAVEYAKKGSGEFGSAIIKYGQMGAAVVGGLAVGAATGGVGLAATATLGRAGASIASSAALNERAAKGSMGAKALLNLGSFASKSSFDLRKAPGISSVLKSAGIKTESSNFSKAMGVSTEGGVIGMRKRREEKDIERASELAKVRDNYDEAKNVRKLERDEENLKEERMVFDENGNEVTVAYLLDQLGKKLDSVKEDREQARADRDVIKDQAGTGGAPGTPTGPTAEYVARQKKYDEANTTVNDILGEMKAIKGAKTFLTSKGRMVDYSELTVDANISEKAIDAIVETARAATASAAEARRIASMPGATADEIAKADEAENTAAHAEGIADSALAARAVTARDTNTDPAQTARLTREATLAIVSANTSKRHIEALATANPTNASLQKAAEAVVNVYGRINNGAVGKSISNLATVDIPNAKQAAHHKEKELMRDYANSVEEKNGVVKFGSWFLGDNATSRDVRQHKIRMGAKEKH